jgi:hypothetical protein
VTKPNPNYRNSIVERAIGELIAENAPEHESAVVDPTWIMRPFIDRWVMLVSYLSVNPRLPRPR